MKKKGAALGAAPGMILSIALLVMIAAASALALSSFKDSQCTSAGYVYSSGQCYTNSSLVASAGDYAVNATVSGEDSLMNLSEQLPTIGTVIGVALIIGVVVGAFAFFVGRQGGL